MAAILTRVKQCLSRGFKSLDLDRDANREITANPRCLLDNDCNSIETPKRVASLVYASSSKSSDSSPIQSGRSNESFVQTARSEPIPIRERTESDASDSSSLSQATSSGTLSDNSGTFLRRRHFGATMLKTHGYVCDSYSSSWSSDQLSTGSNPR